MKTIGTWEEYEAEALRTTSPITPESALRHLSCAGLGLCEEAAELLDAADAAARNGANGRCLAKEETDKVIAEGGDVLWYLSLAARVTGTSLVSITWPDPFIRSYDDATARRIARSLPQGRFQLLPACARFAGIVKKVAHHGRPLAPFQHQARDLFEQILGHTADVLAEVDAGMVNAATANARKLRRRFPHGWSREAAAARADEVKA